MDGWPGGCPHVLFLSLSHSSPFVVGAHKYSNLLQGSSSIAPAVGGREMNKTSKKNYCSSQPPAAAQRGKQKNFKYKLIKQLRGRNFVLLPTGLAVVKRALTRKELRKQLAALLQFN